MNINAAGGGLYTYAPGEFRKVKEQGESLVVKKPGESLVGQDQGEILVEPDHICPCDNQSRDECQLCRDLNTSRDWERMYHKAHALVNLQSIQIHTLLLEKAELQKLVNSKGTTSKKRRHK